METSIAIQQPAFQYYYATCDSPDDCNNDHPDRNIHFASQHPHPRLTVTSTLLAMTHKLRRPGASVSIPAPGSGVHIAVKVAQLQKQVQQQVTSTFTALSSGFTSRLKAASQKGGIFSGLMQTPTPTTTATAAATTATSPSTVSLSARSSLECSTMQSGRASLDLQEASARTSSSGGVSLQQTPSVLQSGYVRQGSVEAGPDPSTIFIHGLDQLVQRTYGQLRDSLKRQLAALLPSCIQAPPLAVVEQYMLEADDSAVGVSCVLQDSCCCVGDV